MAKAFENTRVKAFEAVRTGWLAYLGLYGVAFERAKPRVEEMTEKAGSFFNDLVAKGETVEATAQETLGDVRERTQGIYSAGLTRAKNVVPTRIAANDRIKELEEEVETLNKKVSTLSKPARKTTKRKAA